MVKGGFMLKIYSRFCILFLLFACSSTQYQPTILEKYIDELERTDISKVSIYFNDVVEKLGEPATKSEHEKDFVAVWQESFLIKARIANDLGGRKLILYFDKTTKKLIDKQVKTW